MPGRLPFFRDRCGWGHENLAAAPVQKDVVELTAPIAVKKKNEGERLSLYLPALQSYVVIPLF